MNARRKKLSAIKGGKLAVRAGRSITFAISDVHAPVEDDPSVIGSGPTVITDPSVGSADTTFVLAGSRRDAMNGASAEAVRLGYNVKRIDPPTLGEAREAAAHFADVGAHFGDAAAHFGDAAARFVDTAGQLADAATRGSRTSGGSRTALIAAGETTVTIPPDSRGRGGRNQEFVLAAALALRDMRADWALASVGTDGVDGPTDAAGAIVDSTTLSRAAAAGLDPRAALASHDSYPFFERLGDLVITGPTGTNVGDIQILVVRTPD